MSAKLLMTLPLLLQGASTERLRIELPDPPRPILPRIAYEYGARGPLEICEGKVGISVAEGEGVHILDNVLRVINDDYLITIVPIAPDTKRLARPMSVEGGLTARLYGGAPPDMAAEAELGADRIRYVVTDGSSGAYLLVGSTAFDGSDGDRAILSRLRGMPEAKAGCIRPLSFASDTQQAEQAGFLSYSGARSVALYPPRPIAGPAYHCQGGIGFRIEAGESLLRPWRPLGDGVSRLTIGDGTTITIEGASSPLRRADPEDRSEHPLGLLHESRIIYYPSRGVGPPYAAEGVREDGSWSVELGKDQNSRLEISFPASAHTSAGFRLLERLEIVDAGDPRCAAKSNASAAKQPAQREYPG